MSDLKSPVIFWFGVSAAAVLCFQNCTPMKFAMSDDGFSELASKSMELFKTPEDTAADFNLSELITVATSFELRAKGQVEPRSKHGKIEKFDSKTGKFHYVPDANYNGLDILEISYGYDGEVRNEDVRLTVVPVNDLPMVHDVTLNVPLNETFKLSAASLPVSDVEDGILDLILVDEQDRDVTHLSGTWGTLSLSRAENGLKVYEYLATTLEEKVIKFKVRDSDNAEASLKVTFSVGSSLRDLKPALAIRTPACLLCHSSIKGNIITDYGGTGAVHVPGSGDLSSILGDHMSGNYNHWGNRSFGSTSFIEGTFIVPPLKLNAQATAYLQEVVQQEKAAMNTLPGFGYDSKNNPIFPGGLPTAPMLTETTNAKVTTLAEYLNSIFNHRTNEFLAILKNYPLGFVKSPDIRPISKVREVKSVSISWPTAQLIQKSIQPGQEFSFYRQGGSDVQLKGFTKNARGFFTNSATETFECNGDLFVGGPVFLNDLKIKSEKGCRIYATGTVFIQASNSDVRNRKGIEFSGGDSSNLQISSAKGILLGLGSCTSIPGPDADGINRWTTTEEGILGRRIYEEYHRVMPQNLRDMMSDYNLIRDASGAMLLKDAGNCGGSEVASRSVNFERLLLNAPRVDSRYTGNFKGSVIADFSIWSLGSFHYSYDPVFDNVQILPLIPASSYLQVVDCATGGVDSSRAVANEERFRTCN